MPRCVRVVLCSGSGEVLGELPEFEAEPQWWPEVEPIITGVRERYGVEVSVLRVLDTTTPSGEGGGRVAYLAELLSPDTPATLRPTPYADDPSTTGDDPHRAPWARPHGVAATIDWADAELRAIGRPRVAPAVRVKSWNLSSIIRLPTARGTVWCKSTPPFFAHEGLIMSMIAERDPEIVPSLLAFDHQTSTVLLDDVPGEDQWGAPVERLVEMVHRLVRLQASWAPRTGELLDASLWDWRSATFPHRMEALVHRPDVRNDLTAAEASAVDALIADLPRRLDALASCGLPETLVHGDFHPGNWRFGSRGLVLLDWGDSGVGHPMLDFAAFLPRLTADARPVVQTAWIDAWRAARPGSDPAAAAELIGPVAALRQAALYRAFLDAIEPSEYRYHEDDPGIWIRRAIAAAR